MTIILCQDIVMSTDNDRYFIENYLIKLMKDN